MPEKDGGDRDILSGIRRILEEIREDRKRAEEERKRAEEHRRRADARFEEVCRKSDERFEEVCRRGDQDRKDFRRLILGVGKIGMDIRRALKANTAILLRIDRRLGTLANGRRRGNGHSNGR
ncbi:MAG TPA: hypothetical protein VI643_08160 [Planctomycetota bacterium]|nr:hypothetical protein [Planctomycetota bacterium]